VVVEVISKQAGPVERADERTVCGGGKRGHGRDPFRGKI
jgi:hypothetical protein